MKNINKLLMYGLVVCFILCTAGFCMGGEEMLSGAEQLGWRLGVQAYTFNRFTFFEAVDKIASMNLKYVEAYPGQTISKDSDEKISYTMSDETRKIVKDKLNSAGVKWVCFGVTGAKDEAEWRKLFEFAKDMGIETITCEPEFDQIDYIEELCDHFEINIAIHNHPKNPGSKYWDPDNVLKAVEGRISRIGACADTGHWSRSGFEPVECIRKLKGRIISLHFKDLNVKDPDAHDVHWGTGVCNISGILEELKKQEFQGVFSIEYEYNWDNSVPDVEECIKYFDKVTKSLANSEAENSNKTDL